MLKQNINGQYVVNKTNRKNAFVNSKFRVGCLNEVLKKKLNFLTVISLNTVLSMPN